MPSILHLLSSAAFLWQSINAEWSLNVLDVPPGNFETIIIYDTFSGCIDFVNPTKGWFKEPFENQAWGGDVEFFEEGGCTGNLVDARAWGTVAFKDLQAFQSGTAKSVYVTSPSSSRKRNDNNILEQRSNFTINKFREIVPVGSLPTRSKLQARKGSPNPLDAIINLDRLLDNIGSQYATWDYINISHNADPGVQLIPGDATTQADWANSIASEWTAGRLSGDLTSSHIASWSAVLHGTHTNADITGSVIRTATWRAVQFANEQADTWISFTIADWQGNPIASFMIWMED